MAMFLQEWYFILEWCYVVFVSCLMNVDNCVLKAPLDRLQSCAEGMAKKLADHNLCGLESLKTNGEKQVNQICTRIKYLHKALIRADEEEKVRPNEKI